jgi:uncharacterized protein (TIGR02421 family)
MRRDLANADKVLSETSKEIDFFVVNPVNVSHAKAQFMHGIKNPVLSYPPPPDLLHLRRNLSSIALEEQDALDSIVIEKQIDLIRKIDLLNSVGCFDFTDKSRKLYGIPQRKLVEKAYELINTPLKGLGSQKVTSSDAVSLIRKNLLQFNLKYKIKKEDLVSSCVILPSKKIIKLKKKARFSSDFVNRLVVHEIGTHALRFENGTKQPLSVFRNGLAHYLETEEGLAVFNEERFGVLNPSFMKHYAGRVVAVHTAQQKDFFHTFKELKPFFDKKTAFELALRAKRGLAGTDVPGGYTKDYIYLGGYEKVKDFVEKGGNLADLYVGKVGIEDLKYVKELRLEAPVVPEKFELF